MVPAACLTTFSALPPIFSGKSSVDSPPISVSASLDELERARQQLAQRGLVGGGDDDVADRQRERVFPEAVEPRPRIDGHELAVDAQVCVAARLGPLREVDGPRNYVSLDPQRCPVHVMQLRARLRRENDFDYFL